MKHYSIKLIPVAIATILLLASCKKEVPGFKGTNNSNAVQKISMAPVKPNPLHWPGGDTTAKVK